MRANSKRPTNWRQGFYVFFFVVLVLVLALILILILVLWELVASKKWLRCKCIGLQMSVTILHSFWTHPKSIISKTSTLWKDSKDPFSIEFFFYKIYLVATYFPNKWTKKIAWQHFVSFILKLNFVARRSELDRDLSFFLFPSRSSL